MTQNATQNVKLNYWDDFLGYLAVEAVHGLEYYQANALPSQELEAEIAVYVSGAIRDLPWYFAMPLHVLAGLFQTVCVLLNGGRMSGVSQEKRTRFVGSLRPVPLFGLVWKLVRATGMLRLYDTRADAPSLAANLPLRGRE